MSDIIQSTQSNIWLAGWSLCRREIIRFLRQRSRIVGALATPLVLWVMMGAGMGSSFQSDEVIGTSGYLEYLFPGIIVMTVMFTAIFSTISIIEDRQEGFLQSVLVAPVPRLAIVFGKVMGGTCLALLQGGLLLLLAPLVGVQMTIIGFLLSLLWIILLGIALTGIGFIMAWQLNSTQGFHALMNLFLFPLLALSGAFFPISGAKSWLAFAMDFNPLTYGNDGLRHILYWSRDVSRAELHDFGDCIAVTSIFAFCIVILCVLVASKKMKN